MFVCPFQRACQTAVHGGSWWQPSSSTWSCDTLIFHLIHPLQLPTAGSLHIQGLGVIALFSSMPLRPSFHCAHAPAVSGKTSQKPYKSSILLLVKKLSPVNNYLRSYGGKEDWPGWILILKMHLLHCSECAQCSSRNIFATGAVALATAETASTGQNSLRMAAAVAEESLIQTWPLLPRRLLYLTITVTWIASNSALASCPAYSSEDP